MSFTSASYLLFLPLVFVLYWSVPFKIRWMILLSASVIFYLTWTQIYALLTLVTLLVTYEIALLLGKADPKRKRLLVWIGILVPLIQLFIFKYAGFFGSVLSDLVGVFSKPGLEAFSRLALPVGISFYTFQTIAYVVDVSKGTVKAESHLGHYALFVLFFPHLLSGPIGRAKSLLPQMTTEKAFDETQASTGIKLIVWGLFKKLVVADYLAVTVNSVYDRVHAQTGFAYVLATLLFAIQIYGDFSGYTDIAIGSAKLFGIDLMKNFDSPYFAKSVKEFWNRWHISLSTWFRDYVYFPLGGSRVKLPRYLLNLMITFVISGLWHGANWTFLLWGALHGTYMIIEALIARLRKNTTPKPSWWKDTLKTLLTFTLVSLAWVPFRANSVGDALTVYTGMFSGITNVSAYLLAGYKAMRFSDPDLFRLAIILPLLFVVDGLNVKKSVFERLSSKPAILRYALYVAFGLVAILTYTSVTGATFIYFKF